MRFGALGIAALVAACSGGRATPGAETAKAGGDAGAAAEATPPPQPAWDPCSAPAAPSLDWLARTPDAAAVVLTAAQIGDHTGTTSTAAPLTRTSWLEAALALVGKKVTSGDDPIAGMVTSLGLPPAASFTIDLAPVTAGERLVLIEAAARAGVVIVQLGDKRAVWLGEDDDHAPYGVHAACDSVAIAPIDLAAATAVHAYARTPGQELLGAATMRAASPVTVPEGKACDDSQSAAIFFSPARPSSEQTMRVIATLSHDPGPVELALVDPDGTRHTPSVLHLVGGSPWTYIATVDAPKPGKWTAVLGDGSRVEACFATKVAKKRGPRRGPADTVWSGRRRWSEANENLYAAFVQRLFDYPVDQDLTWPNLHTLLRDKEHNLLYDHLGHNEDEKLKLEPDCADLPYTLRAYFAWKMDLPYGFLVCNRGGSGKPPKCKDTATLALEAAEKAADEEVVEPGLEPEAEIGLELAVVEDEKPKTGRLPGDNHMLRADLKFKDEPGVFQAFFRAMIRAVNSASGRTAPKDELTDWYPVPLTRAALRPGTMYADPYGHLMVMVGWYPQKPGGYGILMGADAQPDSTVGRRRFWRGNYLFTAETKRAGAGFKAYRMRVNQKELVVPWENAKLAKKGWWTPWSTQQYDGSTDDFYDRMEELINPRPLDPEQMQISLVDALEEAVVRRVNSVDNGEQYMKTATKEIDMPAGASIFLTSGPWEDYSTPSRDHRILVAIDTVLGLAAAVERRPERYRLEPAEVPAMLETLAKNLEVLLAGRTFEYARTDGTKHTLSLADVVARAERWEVAYNPNDCVEYRWGAPEGSDEESTCERRAPEWQRKRMEEYRPWFAKRERPVE